MFHRAGAQDAGETRVRDHEERTAAPEQTADRGDLPALRLLDQPPISLPAQNHLGRETAHVPQAERVLWEVVGHAVRVFRSLRLLILA